MAEKEPTVSNVEKTRRWPRVEVDYVMTLLNREAAAGESLGEACARVIDTAHNYRRIAKSHGTTAPGSINEKAEPSRILTEVPDDVREQEFNPRQPPLAANRVGTYVTEHGVRVRFLWADHIGPSLLHPDHALLEVVNVADVVLHPTVALSLRDMLTRAIEQTERRSGRVVLAQHQLCEQWNRNA